MNDPYKKSYILKRILKEGSFEDNYPERALDWDYDDERNQPYKPSDFLSGSNKLIYWIFQLVPDNVCTGNVMCVAIKVKLRQVFKAMLRKCSHVRDVQ